MTILCKTARRAALVLLAALLSFCTVPLAAAETPEVRFLMSDKDWNAIDHSYCRFATKQELLEEVSAYAEAIAALTGETGWAAFYGPGDVAVEIRFTDSASHVEGGYQSYLVKIPRIYINRDMAAYNFWPLAHELTHLMFPEYSCLSLREGLACYMQDEVGKNPAVFNYGLDVHAFARLYWPEYGAGLLVLDANPAYDPSVVYAAGEKRAAFYLCSYSFCRYLIETYGLPPFLALYRSGNIAKTARLVYGRGIDSLVDDWAQSLYDDSESITAETLDRALKNI